MTSRYGATVLPRPCRRRPLFTGPLLTGPLLAGVLLAGPLLAGCSGSEGGSSEVTVVGEDDDTVVVRFIRGADGTGGGRGGGEDLHLSDIDDAEHPQGFATFTALIEGLDSASYEVDQMVEGEFGSLSEALDGVDVVVLGSNNADYTSSDAEALASFVRRGGGALVFNDANYGTDDADAPESDNTLLAPFGLAINQDDGEEGASSPADVAVEGSPLLEGVEGIAWVGAGAVTLTGDAPDAEPRILIGLPAGTEVVSDAEADVTRPAEPGRDAAVAVVEYGGGRVVAVLDRDLFFNPGGVSLDTASNRAFAANAIEWLAGQR